MARRRGNVPAKQRQQKQTMLTRGADQIKDALLHEVAKSNYYRYATATIEDRAIFGNLDGLKPVTRRSLWAIYEMGLRPEAKSQKAAKAVGDTMGKYHPHGDSSIYEAMVTAANCPMKMIDGTGNWGTLTDGQAAMRYTELKLSKYADLTFFDRFYLPCVKYVPNYDDNPKTPEPLNLPALLPNALLNGNWGLTPGVKTETPCYTLASLLPLLKRAVLGTTVTPKMCMSLEFAHKYGGVVYVEEGYNEAADLLEFYKTGKGRVRYDSNYDMDTVRNEIRITGFAMSSQATVDKALAATEALQCVAGTRDDGDKHDPYQKAWVVSLRKNLKGAAFEEAVVEVMEQWFVNVSLAVKVTDRFVQPNEQAGAKLRPSNVPTILNDWAAYRLDLEVRACEHHIGLADREIQRLETMRLAIKWIDTIVKLLKSRSIKDEDLAPTLAKRMKIELEWAEYIFNMPVRRLRALNDAKLVQEIKETKAQRTELVKRKRNPGPYVAEHIAGIAKQLKV